MTSSPSFWNPSLLIQAVQLLQKCAAEHVMHRENRSSCLSRHSSRITLLFTVYQTAWWLKDRAEEQLPAKTCKPHGGPHSVWGKGTGTSARRYVKAVICHATLWQQCCMCSKGPCDLWYYKSWKIPSLPFIYNWKHSNWLQRQAKEAGSTLGDTHRRSRTRARSPLPASQCCVTRLNRGLKINQNYFQIRRGKKNPVKMFLSEHKEHKGNHRFASQHGIFFPLVLCSLPSWSCNLA